MNHRRSERAHFHISKAFYLLPPLMYALIVSQPPLRNHTIKPDAPQADSTQADSRSPSNSDLLDVYEILLAQQQLIAQLTQCLFAVIHDEVKFSVEFLDEYRE